MLRSSLFLVLLMMVACDSSTDDLAGLIGTQNVPLMVTSATVADGHISVESQLTPATFLTRVETELDRDVTHVDLLNVTLSLPTPNSPPWSALFGATMTVSLVPDSTGAALAVASATPPADNSDVAAKVSVSRATLDQFPDIAAGRFKVRLSGDAAGDIASDVSQAVLVRLELSAF